MRLSFITIVHASLDKNPVELLVISLHVVSIACVLTILEVGQIFFVQIVIFCWVQFIVFVNVG